MNDINEDPIKEPKESEEITGMSYPLCPKCKGDLKAVKNKLFKPFHCINCNISFEKRELLSGWMLNTFLKDEYIDNIWRTIILEIQKNQKQTYEEALKREKEAEKCKWYCHKSEYAFRCKKPDDFFEFEEDGTRYCLLGGQYPVDCYEIDIEDKKEKATI